MVALCVMVWRGFVCGDVALCVVQDIVVCGGVVQRCVWRGIVEDSIV